jgi:DNA primase
MTAVDEVKARLDIVEVVGTYVRLQKAGRSFKGLCPFHTEKTPSFVVNPDRQSWHCFGSCGTGGDVISFIARKENMDFVSALRLLADRAGVELRSDGPRREQVKSLQDANEAAALFFHNQLKTAPAAIRYVEERGLDAAAVSDFLLGYAPSGWDALRTHLTSRGFSEQLLVEAGLLVESDRGGYDRFRNRLMFPIRDDRGRVVGFGGRVLPGEPAGFDGPKYMNTPQSPIFDKGSLLYALDRARDAMRQTGTAVIVEGYMDVIAAHQHGFRNVVASMGTSLTERQAALLQRQASRVVLAMDSDEAGSAANLRGVQVVASAASRGSDRTRRQPLDIRVLALPTGKDPDELIRADPAAWPLAVESAKPVLEHLYESLRKEHDIRDARERQLVIDEMLPVIAELPNPVEQAAWVSKVAGGRAREDDLWRRIRSGRRLRAASRKAAPHPGPLPEGEGTGIEEAVPGARPLYPRQRAPREEFCLAMLYQLPVVAHLAGKLSEDLFSLSENRELFHRWKEEKKFAADSEEEDGGLWEHYQEVMETRIEVHETAQAEAAFLDCVGRLEQARMKAVKEASALALAEGVAGVRPGQVASIALARLEAGTTEEAPEDEEAEAVASLLLKDTIAGLNLYRRDEQPDPDSSGIRTAGQAP